jgi:hypothetical protein
MTISREENLSYLKGIKRSSSLKHSKKTSYMRRDQGKPVTEVKGSNPGNDS